MSGSSFDYSYIPNIERRTATATTTTAPTTSSAVLPSNTTVVNTSQYFKEKTVAVIKEEEIDALEARYKSTLLGLEFPIRDVHLVREIKSMEYLFFLLRSYNFVKDPDEKDVAVGQANFQAALKRVIEFEQFVHDVPSYSLELHYEAMARELKAMENRFLLAQAALKDQDPEKIMKLKNDEDFIQDCFHTITEGFNESDLQDLQTYLKEFEDAVEKNNSEDDSDDSDPDPYYDTDITMFD